MNIQSASQPIDDHTTPLYAPQSHAGRMTNLRWLRVTNYFLTRLDVARQRRALLALDERTLKDVGISRIDALREANRYFWDIPEHLKLRR